LYTVRVCIKLYTYLCLVYVEPEPSEQEPKRHVALAPTALAPTAPARMAPALKLMFNISGLSKMSQTIIVSYFSHSIYTNFIHMKSGEEIALTLLLTFASLAWYIEG
jgi:hypothetical protein